MLRLKGCTRCHGDMTFDGQDWQCLQCGGYYYMNRDDGGEYVAEVLRRNEPRPPGQGKHYVFCQDCDVRREVATSEHPVRCRLCNIKDQKRLDRQRIEAGQT